MQDTRYGWVIPFRVGRDTYITVCEKKIIGIDRLGWTWEIRGFYAPMSDQESYYKRNTEARKAYQKAYYAEKKDLLKRKRELDSHLSPEKVQKMQDYQRNYYLTNRQKLLARKKLRYLEQQKGG